MGFSLSTTGVSRAQVSQEVALFLIMDFGGSCSFNNIQISLAVKVLNRNLKYIKLQGK